jgi:hypothetical protein
MASEKHEPPENNFKSGELKSIRNLSFKCVFPKNISETIRWLLMNTFSYHEKKLTTADVKLRNNESSLKLTIFIF